MTVGLDDMSPSQNLGLFIQDAVKARLPSLES